jgi:hypothetical protein
LDDNFFKPTSLSLYFCTVLDWIKNKTIRQIFTSGGERRRAFFEKDKPVTECGLSLYGLSYSD